MLKKILPCSLSREVTVITLFSFLCLKDWLGLCSLICHNRAMTEDCCASLGVLANSVRVVSAITEHPPLDEESFDRLTALK